MKLAYVAGPYRDKRGIWWVLQNIDRAATVARELWSYGFAVICPHQNTRLFDGADVEDARWLTGDIEILRRCDVIVMLPGWERSEGSKVEHVEAMRAGLTVTYWPEDMDKLRGLGAG